MKKLLQSAMMFFVFTTLVNAQIKITGTVLDGEGNTPLPGANVVIKATKIGTTTDFDGKFEISTSLKNGGEISISYLGYISKTVTFKDVNGKANVGIITLLPEAEQLEGVVLTGSSLFDIAKDRKTPVAVSTIKAAEIQQRLGNKEFVEVLNTTPSVYASKGSGGFGDSRITVRGFGQENVAVMINGMPVNDMENGAVYWSNWAGLSDVSNAIQVQRGLGSSKLAISSVGGTINIVTKSSDRKEGGFYSMMTGNNDYRKLTGQYSTGKLKNGLSASILLSSTGGDGYVNGTKFEGQNYFIALGYEFNSKHNIEFTFTGAPQWHHQRGTGITIARYKEKGNGTPNVKWNDDWGYLNGEEFNLRRNFYHKPIGSVNWEFKINETTNLNTMVYGSWGRGGGSGAFGRLSGINYTDNRLRDANGLVNYNLISQYNQGQTVTIPNATFTGFVNLTKAPVAGYGNVNTASNGISMISGINSHNWYGAISSINKKIGNLSINLGADYRTYKGIHVRNLNNLLGANNYLDTKNLNNPIFYSNATSEASPSLNPFFNSTKNTVIDRDWEGLVNWLGGFTQLEYSTDKLSVFLQGAVSNQTYQRVDRFTYLNSDALQTSEKQSRLGGNIKLGANFNINENHNVFGNAGYYSRQPFLNAVFPNNKNILNDNIVNEKVLGFEAGYGFRSSKFNANINIYRTEWKDRFLTRTDTNASNPGGFFVFNGVTQLHQGAELDLNYKPFDFLKINAMFSYGDWKYKGNSTSDTFNNQNDVISTGTTVYIDGVRVGSSAQTTAAFGANVEIVKNLNFNVITTFNDNLYADLNPSSLSNQTNKGTLKLPSYTLLDANISYKWLLGKEKTNSLTFNFNMDNVLNTIYILESQTNIFSDDNVSSTNAALGTYASNNRLYEGVADANRVWFGFGRTWNFGVRFDF